MINASDILESPCAVCHGRKKAGEFGQVDRSAQAFGKCTALRATRPTIELEPFGGRVVARGKDHPRCAARSRVEDKPKNGRDELDGQPQSYLERPQSHNDDGNEKHELNPSFSRSQPDHLFISRSVFPECPKIGVRFDWHRGFMVSAKDHDAQQGSSSVHDVALIEFVKAVARANAARDMSLHRAASTSLDHDKR